VRRRHTREGTRGRQAEKNQGSSEQEVLVRIRHWLSAIAALLILTPSVVSAQAPMRFSAHTGLGAPIGRLGDNADLGFNLGLRGEVAVNPKWISVATPAGSDSVART